MSDALYERYKEALRRGHVASARGRPDEALVAYQEAIAIAPDRPMPYASVGAVLVGIGRFGESIGMFDRALELDPSFETALHGRADALLLAGRPIEAAEAFDRLAKTLDADGRLAEACDAARRALEAAESRDRRTDLEGYVRRLRTDGHDMAATVALGRALAVLEVRIATAAESVDPLSWPGADPLPSPPPPTLAARLAGVDRAIDHADPEAVRSSVLEGADALRRAGLTNAALDTCFLALDWLPADPAIHLAMIELYLDKGWRSAAIDKMTLLGRWADLADDPDTHARLAVLVADRLGGEPGTAASPA